MTGRNCLLTSGSMPSSPRGPGMGKKGRQQPEMHMANTYARTVGRKAAPILWQGQNRRPGGGKPPPLGNGGH